MDVNSIRRMGDKERGYYRDQIEDKIKERLDYLFDSEFEMSDDDIARDYANSLFDREEPFTDAEWEAIRFKPLHNTGAIVEALESAGVNNWIEYDVNKLLSSIAEEDFSVLNMEEP